MPWDLGIALETSGHVGELAGMPRYAGVGHWVAPKPLCRLGLCVVGSSLQPGFVVEHAAEEGHFRKQHASIRTISPTCLSCR